MASGKILYINSFQQRGRYTPVLLSGGASVTFDTQIEYYKFGPLCLLTQAFWSFSITNPNNDNFVLSLPFTCSGIRCQGLFGYNNSGEEKGVAINPNGMSWYRRNSNGSIYDLKGTDLQSFVGQWSAVYSTP